MGSRLSSSLKIGLAISTALMMFVARSPGPGSPPPQHGSAAFAGSVQEWVGQRSHNTAQGITPTSSPIPTATPTVRVVPNSPYSSGLNAIAVEGPSDAASVDFRVEIDSRRDVLAIWVFRNGTWDYYVSGGPVGPLTAFPSGWTAAFVVLA